MIPPQLRLISAQPSGTISMAQIQRKHEKVKPAATWVARDDGTPAPAMSTLVDVLFEPAGSQKSLEAV